MKFKFKLETALKLVELDETKKIIEIGRVNQKVTELNQKIIQLHSNIQTLLQWSIGQEIEWKRLEYQSRKIEVDRIALQHSEQNLIDITNLLKQKQQELSQILMKRKAFERKEERDYKEFRLRVTRKIQKQADEDHQLLKQRVKAES